MSEFEIVTIPLGFILGLGVALILTSLAAAIRDRFEHPLHWLPLTWAAMIFVLQIQFWFGLEDMNTAIGDWNWVWYSQMIFSAVLVFLAGALVLPTREGRVPGGLIKDFEAHGRLSALAFAAYCIGWLWPNARMNDSWFILPNLLNVGMAAAAIVTFQTKEMRTRAISTVAVSALLLYALTFVYSRPGPETVS